jgi:hypothetical protein
MSTAVILANLLGLLTGEWRYAPTVAKRRLAGGITLLIAAIAALGCANGMHA